MNVFYEFYKVARQLELRDVKYALIGGVAMAFYNRPRFTRDIDVLINMNDLDTVSEALMKEGFKETAHPWTFKNTALTLHRFFKTEEDDEMIIDVLIAGSKEHQAIISRARVAESDTLGKIYVAQREDLVALKQLRNSKLDQVDIDELKNEKP